MMSFAGLLIHSTLQPSVLAGGTSFTKFSWMRSTPLAAFSLFRKGGYMRSLAIMLILREGAETSV